MYVFIQVNLSSKTDLFYTDLASNYLYNLEQMCFRSHLCKRRWMEEMFISKAYFNSKMY